MNKLPAFQFYPSDWRSDPGIQALSFEDRGVWFEILCLMHESPRRGVLLLPNGTPMMSVSLARIIGMPLPKLVKALDRISAVGVSDREQETGALVNRRMVRDEHIRQVRADAGRLGGNPDLLKQNPSKQEATPEQEAEQIPTPSSSSSSSISKEGDIPPNPRKPYGEFSGVLLTDAEEQKLRLRLNSKFQHYVDRLDRYSQTDPRKFRRYKSHYATILSWADRDGHGQPGDGGYRLA